MQKNSQDLSKPKANSMLDQIPASDLTPSQYLFAKLVVETVQAFKLFQFPLPNRQASIDGIRCEWVPVDELNKVGFHVYNSAKNDYGQPSSSASAIGLINQRNGAQKDLDQITSDIATYQYQYDNLQTNYEDVFAKNSANKAESEEKGTTFTEIRDTEFHDRVNAAEVLNQAIARQTSLSEVLERYNESIKAQGIDEKAKSPKLIRDLYFEVEL